jgi:hypothetical protein
MLLLLLLLMLMLLLLMLLLMLLICMMCIFFLSCSSVPASPQRQVLSTHSRTQSLTHSAPHSPLFWYPAQTQAQLPIDPWDPALEP